MHWDPASRQHGFADHTADTVHRDTKRYIRNQWFTKLVGVLEWRISPRWTHAIVVVVIFVVVVVIFVVWVWVWVWIDNWQWRRLTETFAGFAGNDCCNLLPVINRPRRPRMNLFRR